MRMKPYTVQSIFCIKAKTGATCDKRDKRIQFRPDVFVDFSELIDRQPSVLIISPVSEGSGDVMVLRRSCPPPAARNGVNAITKKPRDGLFSNLVYTLVVIVS